MTAPGAVQPWLWLAIVNSARWRCVACGQYACEVDHVRPRALGGRAVPGNLVVLCHQCNTTKSDYWPAGAYHPFPGYDDQARADAIFEAEIAWLRDIYDEDEILDELWWRHRERLAGP